MIRDHHRHECPHKLPNQLLKICLPGNARQKMGLSKAHLAAPKILGNPDVFKSEARIISPFQAASMACAAFIAANAALSLFASIARARRLSSRAGFSRVIWRPQRLDEARIIGVVPRASSTILTAAESVPERVPKRVFVTTSASPWRTCVCPPGPRKPSPDPGSVPCR